jgi:putative inorganic carbon (HCO3(-)) transporter
MFYIYLVLIVSIFLHLPSRIPALGAIRFDLLLYTILAVGAAVQALKITPRPSEEITRKLLLLLAYIVLSLPLVKWPGSVLRDNFLEYAKVVVFFFFTLSYVTSQKRLKLFMLVFLGCQVFRGLEPAYLHLTTGYWGSTAHSLVGGGLTTLDRLSGAPHDIVNPNQLAWVIVNTVPFLYFLAWRSNSNLLRLTGVGVACLLLYPLFLTGSRSGLIILIVVILAILVMEGLKPKVIVAAAIILVPGAMFITNQLSFDLAQRYLSIIDKNAVGADTFNSRISGAVTVFRHMTIRAVFGHGLGTSRETNANMIGRSNLTHNMYLEAIQEIGVVGLAILLGYIYAIWRSLGDLGNRMTQAGMRDTGLQRLALALKAWIPMELVYCLACFALNHWEWYLFGGVAAACANLAAQAVEENSTTDTAPESPAATRHPMTPKIRTA